MLRWLVKNLSTLILSLALAVLVWVVAINEENPIEERTLTESMPIELANLPSDLILTSTPPDGATITLRAPRSVLDALNPSQIHITANLLGYAAGSYEVTLSWSADTPATQLVKLEPAAVTLTLENRAVRERPLRVDVRGEPAPGYQPGSITTSATTVNVTGPASAVDRVSEVVAVVGLDSLKHDFANEVSLSPLDAAGKLVLGVTLNPAIAQVLVPISQKVGYRDVAVSPVITGQVAAGYRITNITVAPLIITVSSADPLKVNGLLGFVQTEPLDISGASDDIIRQLAVTLPAGVTPVDVQSVQVQVNIAAIESGLTVPRDLEVQGLGVGLVALPSPATVDVLLTGPLPILDQLQPTDVRVVLDLTGLEPGTHQITPQVILLPQKLRAENVLPSVIEVVISPQGTPTPTLTPTETPAGTAVPSSTATPTPRAPTRTPRPPTLAPSITPSTTPASPL